MSLVDEEMPMSDIELDEMQLSSIEFEGEALRAALAAGDLVKAEQMAWNIESRLEQGTASPVVQAAIRRTMGRQSHAKLLTKRFLAALKADDDNALCRAAASATFRLSRLDGPYWLTVLKELENGILRAIGPAPRKVSPKVKRVVRSLLERDYRDRLEFRALRYRVRNERHQRAEAHCATCSGGDEESLSA